MSSRIQMRDGAPPCDLVTGALGFAGLYLVRGLLASGREVIGLGRNTDGSLSPPAHIRGFERSGPGHGPQFEARYESGNGSFRYLSCPLEDATALGEVIAANRPSVVYHLAAQSSAAASFAAPRETMTSNLLGTLNLLEIVRHLSPERRPVLVVVGSAEEYGAHAAGTVPLTEDVAVEPVSPYAVSKAAQSLLCRQYARSFGLPVVIARSFSHTGPGQDLRFAFPSFARQIAAAESGSGPMEIQVGDLSAMRDYLDVRDVVSAYRALADRGRPGEIYNVCSGTALTMDAGLRILVAAATVPIAIRQDPARLRPSDAPCLVGNNHKLTHDTGWRPEMDLAATLLELLAEARKEFA